MWKVRGKFAFTRVTEPVLTKLALAGELFLFDVCVTVCH